MRRVPAVMAAALLGLTALVGCGLRAGDGGGWTEVAADLSPEQAALSALGYEVGAPAGGSAAAVTGESAEGGRADRWQERRRWVVSRVLLRRNALHGEAVVQTADGTVSVLFQRGEVVSVTGTTTTVRSADGFELTWTFGTELRVIEARSSVEPRPLAAGDPVGVAGTRIDGEPVARLIAIDGR